MLHLKITGDWKLIYFLIVLTGAAALLTIITTQTIGTYFYWAILFLIFIYNLLKEKYWSFFLVLVVAFSSLSVFQAGIIVGYNAWLYLIIITTFFLSVKIHVSYFSFPGFKWWFFLLILGIIHLPFIEWSPAFIYSKNAVILIAAGLSAFGIAYELSVLRGYREAISQISFLTMCICSLSLIIPFYLSHDIRIGGDIGMDANGLGITAIYAFFSGLIYLLFNRSKKNVFMIILITLFITVILVRTGSRQAISSCILILGLYVVFTFKKNLKLQYIIILLCFFISFSFFISASRISYMGTRFNKIFTSERGIDRINHLKVSLYMAKDHPLGLGGGGFKEHYYKYSYDAGVEDAYMHISPHTLFGMVLADWGFPGILFLLAGFFVLTRHIIKLKDETFIIKIMAIIIFFFLANLGMSFLALFMIFLGMRSFTKSESLQLKRIMW